LPPEAYLTKGVAIADGEWLVKSNEIAKAELIVPRSKTSLLGLEVAALDEKTGEEAAPPKQMNVALDLAAVPLPGAVPPPEQLDVRVEPVSAMPDQGFNKSAETTPVPIPLQDINAEALKLLNKGQALLKNGDLIAARQFFLKAHALKLPEAAYYVGQTYDPATYNVLRVVGLQPDIQLASEWYGKAAAQGVAQANEALTKLSAR
jgi:TPR repeat protein